MSRLRSGIDPRLTGIPNPFEDAAVGSVWEPVKVDVPEIHADILQDLLKTIEERRNGIHHACILLHGDAGSGKTHALRRLRLALQERAGPFIPFSWMWMQTSPTMMWRYVRRQLTEDLVRQSMQGSQLDRLLATRGDRIEHVGYRDLSVVLEHLREGRDKRDARAWLAGANLPDAALERLGVAPHEVDEEVEEDASRQLVEALAEFVGPEPIVLCLDQLEALQSYPGDKNGLFAIGKLMSALHRIPNAVVVGCLQTGVVGDLERAVSAADLDRMQAKPMRRLAANEVRALVQARLATQPEIAARRPGYASPFWPIDIERLDSLVESTEGLSARKTLFESGRMFRRAQQDATPEPSLEEHLARKTEERRRRAEKEVSADTSANVLSDGLPRLLHLRGIHILQPERATFGSHVCIPPEGREIRIALVNEDARRVWRKLDKIAEAWDPQHSELVLVRDALNPLPDSARASHERIERLRQRGARIVMPSREALLATDALRRLLADTESGDLTYQGDRLPANRVEDWVRANLPAPVAELLDGIVVGKEQPDGLDIRLAAYLDREKIARIADIAVALETTAERVESCARQNHHQFGLLYGAEPAVFERVAALSRT
ncbi:MAG: AAA family ATPase [Bryobacteraceae bacterium]|nr:AAA family ATPase [Bryobacteraceae bacterium]